MESLVEEVVESFRKAVEAENSQWVSAAIPFEVREQSISMGVAYLFDLGGNASGVRLDTSVELTRQLVNALSDSTGTEVRRVRVTVRPDWSTSIDHFGPSSDPDLMRSHLGVWPDEPGYEGRFFVRPEMERSDSWEYRLVTGSVGEPRVSLGRIGAWLGANEPEFAALLNPGASVDELDRLEDELGVVLPRSVREAWLVHDGQSGHLGVLHYEWLSVSRSAEELQWFRTRSDGGAGFIPVLKFDGLLGFVESVSKASEDGPVWLWETDDVREMRLGDSFGEYLAWFADACEAGHITRELSYLLFRAEL